MAETRASFEEYVRARTPALMRIAYLVAGNAHDAEDLLQSALERAAVRWRHLDDPEAYLRRVIYTQSVSRWRRLRARPPETLTDAPPERSTEVDHDTRLVLAGAISRLTPKQRAVLVLRHYEDRTETEAAILLGVSVGTLNACWPPILLHGSIRTRGPCSRPAAWANELRPTVAWRLWGRLVAAQ